MSCDIVLCHIGVGFARLIENVDSFDQRIQEITLQSKHKVSQVLTSKSRSYVLRF